MSNPQVKFQSNDDGGWKGNCLGTLPNSYTVMVDDNDVGFMWREHGQMTGLGDWQFIRREPTVIGDVKFDHAEYPAFTAPTFVELKVKVREAFAATA